MSFPLGSIRTDTSGGDDEVTPYTERRLAGHYDPPDTGYMMGTDEDRQVESMLHSPTEDRSSRKPAPSSKASPKRGKTKS